MATSVNDRIKLVSIHGECLFGTSLIRRIRDISKHLVSEAVWCEPLKLIDKDRRADDYGQRVCHGAYLLEEMHGRASTRANVRGEKCALLPISAQGLDKGSSRWISDPSLAMTCQVICHAFNCASRSGVPTSVQSPAYTSPVTCPRSIAARSKGASASATPCGLPAGRPQSAKKARL